MSMLFKTLNYLLYKLFFLITIAHGFILRNACQESGEFSIIRENFVLQGSILKTLISQTYLGCQHSCIGHPLCKSFNVEKKELGECQLNEKTFQNSSDGATLTRRFGWIYASTNLADPNIGETCQKLKPCKAGEMCVDTCDCPGFKCHENCNGTRNSTTENNDGTIKEELPCAEPGKKNCAFQKPANFSAPFEYSHKGYGLAPNAVNGMYGASWRSCAASIYFGSQSGIWFMIDLQAVTVVNEIIIFSFFSLAYDVRVGNSSSPALNPLCTDRSTVGRFEMKRFVCDKSMKGRFASVHSDRPMILCEVEVYGDC